MKMDIKELRRERLREWLRTHPTPAAERSFFSQLLAGTAPFGERAARRLEQTYDMGLHYLDTPLEQAPAPAPVHAPQNEAAERMDLVWVTPREMRILTQYRASSERGKEEMEVAADVSEKERSPLRSVGNDKA
jgi:hypothetical protein